MHSTEMRQETHPVLIFDGICNLCELSVVFIVNRDKNAKFRFVAAQSGLGQELQQEFDIDAMRDTTMVLLKDGKLYTKSDAAIEIAKDLDGLWKALRVISVLPRSWRDSAYNYIANNRYRWFGQKQECLLPGDDVRSRFPGL
jgi:predicted DCC family thiol-disulfide oxidoreductase YuxK